ncbi:MAG TPA: hypothetical protein PKN54_00475 [Candidatus Cloacimonas acidaminovorans]|nr:hypothetical protein [Candidatus Cloacimonas acidaminovorans]
MKEIILKPFQDEFLYSKAKNPAMISAWGTGKTLLAILRVMIYSEHIPFNHGVIFRKELTDLRDSTMKDFESNTKLKVNSRRDVVLRNHSIISFRHLEEINNIQNMNLGWFFIEQAEEMPTDKEFFTLWGRLRRKVVPDETFKSLGLPLHTGFIIGNVRGRNWIYNLWKQNNSKDKDFHLIEATTYDNIDVLNSQAPDYIEGLEKLKFIKPEIYKRFVLNDWDVEAEGKAIREIFIRGCIGGKLEDVIGGENYILGVDLAKYLDYTVIVVIKKSTRQVVYFERFNETSWFLQKSRIIAVARMYNNATIVPDSTGVGDPIVEDLEREGCDVFFEKDGDRLGFVFSSKSKQQLIENLIICIEQKKVSYPDIPELIEELIEFSVETKSLNNVRYSAPEGKHDDCVIALALALWGVERNVEPRISFL